MRIRHWCKQTRYYRAEIRSDLFAGRVLELSWGGVGRRPNRRVVRPFGSPAEAEAALRAVADRRQRRGYELVYEVNP